MSGAPRITVRRSLVTVNGHAQPTSPKPGRPRSFQIDSATAAAGLVCTQEDGTRVQPESLTKTFRGVGKGAGPPPLVHPR